MKEREGEREGGVELLTAGVCVQGQGDREVSTALCVGRH